MKSSSYFLSLLFLILFTLAPSAAHAQFTGGNNYNFYDFQNKPFYFGLTLGFNSSRYTPFRSEEFIYSDSIIGVKSLNGPGFNLNMIANLKIGQYFDFRFLPGFSFAERRLNYTQNTRIVRETQESLRISPHDFHIEYGAGVQFFFDYFIFSPEFKISQGIGNTLLFNPNLPESTVLDKVLSRTFTLSFHIEG